MKNMTHITCPSLRSAAVGLRLRANFRLDYFIAVKKFIMFTLLLSAFLSTTTCGAEFPYSIFPSFHRSFALTMDSWFSGIRKSLCYLENVDYVCFVIFTI
ncbi:MAG TPA: hypothetical protein PLT92_03310 [Ignavibacteriaceae bacterium]|jgi:hypothetical protein|nr:hypothetical protein [Ignavibacteriaceae bacterium]